MEERKDSIQTPRTIAREVSKAQSAIDEYLTTSEEYAHEMRRMEDADPDHLYESSHSSDEWSDEVDEPVSDQRSNRNSAHSTVAQNRVMKYYQCLAVGLMFASLVMIGAMIVHFWDLSTHLQDRLAYYRYLHKALGIRREDLANGRNTSVLEACYAAIHDEEVVLLYHAANIHLSHLDVNMEEMNTAKGEDQFKDSKKISHSIRNKKYRLIALCDTELQLMINKMKRRQAEYERIGELIRIRNAREDGKDALMQNAIRLRNDSLPLDNTTINFIELIDACDQALTNETVLAFYETAGFNMTDLRWITKVTVRDMYKHIMRPREEVVLECAMNLFVYDLITPALAMNDTQPMTQESAIHEMQDSMRKAEEEADGVEGE